MVENDDSWTVGYTVPAELAGIFDESKYNVSSIPSSILSTQTPLK